MVPQGPYGTIEERLGDRRAGIAKHRAKDAKGKGGVRAWIANWRNKKPAAGKPAAPKPAAKKKPAAPKAAAPKAAAASGTPENVQEARSWIAKWRSRGKP